MWLIANVSGFSAEAMGFTHDLPAVNSSGRLSSLPPPPPAGPVACLLVTAFVPPAVSPVSCGCVAGPPGPSSRRAVCGARFTGAWSFDFFCFFSGCHLMGFG